MSDTVFLAIPSYDGTLRKETQQSFMMASNEFQVIHSCHQWSALPYCFNQIWCEFLNLRLKYQVKYFVMLHADIGVESYWVDTMVKMLERERLDVLSVVSPIKDDRGLTSTSVVSKATGIAKRRLVVKELVGLPEVFRLKDLGWSEYPESKYCLGVNTGVMVIKVGDWCEKIHFQFRDWIERDPETRLFVPGFIPEDWDVSRQFKVLGLEVGATAKVKLDHFGMVRYSNQGSWGKLERDEIG